MADTTLTDMIGLVAGLLVDGGHVVWSTEMMTVGTRLALGEYNIQAAQLVTLSGLDGAISTTLPKNHEGLLVIGASGWTVLAGQADNLFTPLPPDYGMSKDLYKWASDRLVEFRALMAQAMTVAQVIDNGDEENARLADLRAGAAPWGQMADPGDEFD